MFIVVMFLALGAISMEYDEFGPIRRAPEIHYNRHEKSIEFFDRDNPYVAAAEEVIDLNEVGREQGNLSSVYPL